MKTFPKILTTFFLAVFIIQIICLSFLLLAPAASQAADPATFKPQIEIPDIEKEFGAPDKTGGYAIPGSTASIAKYIKAIYKYAIGIVGILAAVVLMIGGVIWLTAGGSAERIGQAKAWIASSLTGLLLALLSYTILATVNPALVDLKISAIKPVEPTAPPTAFDATIPCGQQVPGQDRICGSKCDAGKKCEKVPRGTLGARECLETLNGSGDYWLCSTLSAGGTACCTGNNDAQCQSGYVCNMRMITGACLSGGVCASKQNINGICGENADCISNNCDTGWLATYRCK